MLGWRREWWLGPAQRPSRPRPAPPPRAFPGGLLAFSPGGRTVRPRLRLITLLGLTISGTRTSSHLTGRFVCGWEGVSASGPSPVCWVLQGNATEQSLTYPCVNRFTFYLVVMKHSPPSIFYYFHHIIILFSLRFRFFASYFTTHLTGSFNLFPSLWFLSINFFPLFRCFSSYFDYPVTTFMILVCISQYYSIIFLSFSFLSHAFAIPPLFLFPLHRLPPGPLFSTQTTFQRCPHPSPS